MNAHLLMHLCQNCGQYYYLGYSDASDYENFCSQDCQDCQDRDEEEYDEPVEGE